MLECLGESLETLNAAGMGSYPGSINWQDRCQTKPFVSRRQILLRQYCKEHYHASAIEVVAHSLTLSTQKLLPFHAKIRTYGLTSKL